MVLERMERSSVIDRGIAAGGMAAVTAPVSFVTNYLVDLGLYRYLRKELIGRPVPLSPVARFRNFVSLSNLGYVYDRWYDFFPLDDISSCSNRIENAAIGNAVGRGFLVFGGLVAAYMGVTYLAAQLRGHSYDPLRAVTESLFIASGFVGFTGMTRDFLLPSYPKWSFTAMLAVAGLLCFAVGVGSDALSGPNRLELPEPAIS